MPSVSQDPLPGALLKRTSMNTLPKTSAADGDAPAAAVPRLMSVDALRGFDMFWIVGATALVRAISEMSPNAVTRFLTTQLEHAKWEGVHFYDVIYPLFLFIVGAVIPYSLSRKMQENTSFPSIYKSLIRRFIILFVLGWIVQGNLLDLDCDKYVNAILTVYEFSVKIVLS